MQNLKVNLVQADLAWENATENIRHLTHLIEDIGSNEIVVLPEMFATGFTMKPEVFAQKGDGDAVNWMKSFSANKVICGSLSIEENGKYFNRFYWVEDGKIRATYDKRHLFSMGSEPRHYSAGESKIALNYMGWNINPFICYDVRFPVWCRNTEESELMLFVANWPEVRIKAWERLLVARAIENQCYVAAVNRIGEDGHGVYHNGCSLVIDPWGETMAKAPERELVLKYELNAAKITEFRQQFPVLKGRDNFALM